MACREAKWSSWSMDQSASIYGSVAHDDVGAKGKCAKLHSWKTPSISNWPTWAKVSGEHIGMWWGKTRETESVWCLSEQTAVSVVPELSSRLMGRAALSHVSEPGWRGCIDNLHKDISIPIRSPTPVPWELLGFLLCHRHTAEKEKGSFSPFWERPEWWQERERQEERNAALWAWAPLVWCANLAQRRASKFVILLVTGQRQAGSIFKLSLLLKVWYMKGAISVVSLSQLCSGEGL